jgi:hypothetical protein
MRIRGHRQRVMRRRRLCGLLALSAAFVAIVSRPASAQGTPVPAVGLYWLYGGNPTTGGGVCAPQYQLLFRTDNNTLYYKSGAACTAWTVFAGGGGGAVSSITCLTGVTCTPNPITSIGTIAADGSAPTGMGTANTVTKWLTADTLGNSSIGDDGTTVSTAEVVSLGSLSPLHNTTVNGELLGVFASFQNAGQNTPTISATNTTTGETSGKIGIQSSVSGSVDTTTEALTSYGVEATNTATRSAGTNAATNIGIYASAGGAQINQAAYFNQGDVYVNNASNGSNTFNGPTTINNKLSTEELDLPSFVTATNLTGGTVNNWDPTNGTPGNLDSIERVNVAPTANTTVTGLIIGDSGQVLSIHNTSTSFTVTFTYQGAGSTAANRFTWPNAGSYELGPLSAITVRTSASASGWNPWSSATQNQPLTATDLLVATDTNQIGDYAGSTAGACSPGSVVTNVAFSASGVVTTTCTPIGTAGGVTGSGSSGDLAVWSDATSLTNFVGTTNGQAPVWNGSTWIADDNCDDPTLRYCMIEEFENINTSCTTLGAKMLGTTSGAGAQCGNSGFEGHPGVLTMLTGTTAAGVSVGRSAPNGAIVFGGGFGQICNTMLLYIPVLSTSVIEYIVRDGFNDQFAAGQATNGVEVVYDRAAHDGGNGGNFWELETSSTSSHTVSTCDGTGSTTSEAVSAATWTLAEVCVDTNAANAYLFINGTQCTSITTNIPNGTSHLDSFGLQIQNNSGSVPASEAQYIDFMKVTLPFTVAR